MSDPHRVFLVVNPHSANGSTGREWPDLLRTIQSTLGEVEFQFTQGPMSATSITRDALKRGFDRIVAVGGDGTNNEVVNGFFEADRPVNPEAVFGFVCRGTGGDFRKTFGWSTDLREALGRLTSGVTKRVDVGRIEFVDHGGRPTSRYYLNITSFGISGLVDHLVNTHSKAFGGRISFLLATVRALWRYRNQEIRLRIDDGAPMTLKINTLAVANGRMFGGGMQIAPEASVTDGLFDIVSLGDFTTWEMMTDGTKVYKGAHLNLPKVGLWRGNRVVAEPVRAGEAVLIDLDGEAPGQLPASFTLLPGALRLAWPAESKG